MPKEGYKSITIRQELWDIINKNYKERKDDLAKRGIYTRANYIVSLLLD